MKFCKKCGCDTERNKYGKCKPCDIVSTKAWNKANPERLRSRKAAWYTANRDRIRAKKAAQYAENPEKIKAESAAWRKANPDKARALFAAWKAANPESIRLHHMNRRARKRGNGGTLSSDLSERLFKLQRGKCACCKQPLGNDYHLDHIMPLALGGTNTDHNIQLLHATCNLKKHAKHPVDFMKQLGFLL